VLKNSIAELYHFDAAPTPGWKNDAAPAMASALRIMRIRFGFATLLKKNVGNKENKCHRYKTYLYCTVLPVHFPSLWRRNETIIHVIL
jgi:hypothetical protein